MTLKDEIEPILCIGGPYNNIKYRPDVDTYMTAVERLGYFQYKSGWHPQTFIWVWKDLIG